MKNVTWAIVAGIALATPAYADNKESTETNTKTERHADGSYKTKSSAYTTDASGTARKMEVEERASTDSDGDKKVVSNTETSTDPKGLMNKTTAERRTELNSDARGSYDRETSAKSVDAQGTKRTFHNETEKDVDSDGSSKTTVTSKRVEDPKGLMNKQTAEEKKTIKTDAAGQTSMKVEKKLNGDTVEETNR